MNVIQKLSLMLLCVLSSSTVFSFIASYSHLKKGEKEVFLLGDCHARGKIDIDERDLLLRYLCASERYDQPISFIIEGHEKSCLQELENIEKTDFGLDAINRYMISAIRTIYILSKDSFMDSNLSFVYGDLRPFKGYRFHKTAEFSEEYGYEDYVADAGKLEGEAFAVLGHLDSPTVVEGIRSCIDQVASGNKDEVDCADNFARATDKNFFVQVIKSLQKSNKSLLYAGYLHTDDVREQLKLEGFEEVEHQAYSDRDIRKHINPMLPLFGIPNHIDKDDHFFDVSLLTDERLLAMFGCQLSARENIEKLIDFGLYKRKSLCSQNRLFVGLALVVAASAALINYYDPESLESLIETVL